MNDLLCFINNPIFIRWKGFKIPEMFYSCQTSSYKCVWSHVFIFNMWAKFPVLDFMGVIYYSSKYSKFSSSIDAIGLGHYAYVWAFLQHCSISGNNTLNLHLIGTTLDHLLHYVMKHYSSGAHIIIWERDEMPQASLHSFDLSDYLL